MIWNLAWAVVSFRERDYVGMRESLRGAVFVAGFFALVLAVTAFRLWIIVIPLGIAFAVGYLMGISRGEREERERQETRGRRSTSEE